MWRLGFISEQDFRQHVQLTIQQYGDKLAPFDLQFFNRNIIDPIKLIFDKSVYRLDWDEIVKSEIFRQRDKSNNNNIGYFHQRLFQYVKGCTVPQAGWDVIYSPDGGIDLPDGDHVRTAYVEMKNKHNTMNSSASGKIYIKMQGQLLKDDDCACLLVEVIARQSQNITWEITVDKEKQKHRRIRRVSIDEFYALVTGQADAFHQMCMTLPSVIADVVASADTVAIPNDTVIQELRAIADQDGGNFAFALYMLGFSSYAGFKK